MKNGAQNLATLILVACALVITGLIIKREFVPANVSLQGREINNPQLLTADGEVLGRADAPIQIVEFADFQCPACAAAHIQLERLRDKYPDQISIVYRHFPLDGIHGYALRAALASECAADQGFFPAYHATLFEKQDSIGIKSFMDFATDVGIPDERAFQTCLEQQTHEEAIQHDIAAANRVGVNATPTLIIAGHLYTGALSLERIEDLLAENLRE